MSKIIRILLVDDHMVVRRGIMHVLSEVSDFSTIGEAENGEEALFLSTKLKPDIVLMDVQMSGMGGIEATRMIVQHHSSARVIGLSTFANRESVSGMIEAGACGYLLKNISADELTDAIRRVHGGEIIIPTELPENRVREPEIADIGDDLGQADTLGIQQKKVLRLMTKGFTNPEIAEHLGISSPTARYHVSAILRKLDVSNRSEAVALAIRLNLIDADDF